MAENNIKKTISVDSSQLTKLVEEHTAVFEPFSGVGNLVVLPEYVDGQLRRITYNKTLPHDDAIVKLRALFPETGVNSFTVSYMTSLDSAKFFKLNKFKKSEPYENLEKITHKNNWSVSVYDSQADLFSKLSFQGISSACFKDFGASLLELGFDPIKPFKVNDVKVKRYFAGFCLGHSMRELADVTSYVNSLQKIVSHVDTFYRITS